MKNVLMRNVLCYSGIIILLFFTALPPVLRLVTPKEDENKEQVEVSSLLSCTNQKYTSRSSYINDEIEKFVIKRTGTVTQPETSETPETPENPAATDNENQENTQEDNPSLDAGSNIPEEDKTELDIAFDELKNRSMRPEYMSAVFYTAVSDGEVIQVDFTASKDKMGLEQFFQTVQRQRAFYESFGLECSIN